MKGKYYTNERGVQILIYLLKAYNIRKIVASPGTTNLSFVASLQQDAYFEMYSSVDERSAAYIACGLAAESGEPVVLTCTGATASRNYMPGLTEAFYRKLPVLAVTSTQDISRIGHHIAQVIDRRSLANDIALLSEHIPNVKDDISEWDCTIKINRALSELRHRGGGPVHLSLSTLYSRDFSVKELPTARVIRRITQNDIFPEIPQGGRIGIFIGAHHSWTEAEIKVVDDFCASHNAVVFCDHTSRFTGKYRLQFALFLAQESSYSSLGNLDLLIHLGEVSGDYPSLGLIAKTVWRVSEDGELRDTFKRLTYVFEMPEKCFFSQYLGTKEQSQDAYLKECMIALKSVRDKVPELPFSNTWIAAHIAHRLPEHSVLHLGILNSLRNWNFFEIPASVQAFSNTGGFGIDGILSTFIGASLVNRERLYFAVLGDLAFFYDMNVVGNRHVGKNVRILLVNNGTGVEFRNYNHPGAAFGDDADLYIAAGGHYGNKSSLLVKHYAEDLGYEYLSATTKEEFIAVADRFLLPEPTGRSIIFEVFTTSEDESKALQRISNLKFSIMGIAKRVAKKVLPQRGLDIAKSLIGKSRI